MWLSRERKSFLALIVMLFTQITACSSQGTCPAAVNSSCKLQEVQFSLDAAIDFVNKAKESLKGMKIKCCDSKPEDCNTHYKCGKKDSGVYTIWPRNRLVDRGIDVYCDMKTEGGGWTVIQRRGDFGNAPDYFYKDWISYKEGFGDPSKDHWLGNDIIFALTNQRNCSIRFDLTGEGGEERYAKYNDFWIDSEDSNYTLHVNGYTGDAGDCFSYHSGQQFSTLDRDNDKRSFSCAVVCRGAWWYKACYQSNLNALYLNGYHPENRYQGINWVKWTFENYSLPFTEMKIKPVHSAEENCGEPYVLSTC